MFSAEIPAAETSTSFDTRVGNASASSAPMNPPIELPTTTGDSISSCEHSASITRANPWIEIRPDGISEPPNPGRSGATTRKRSMNAGMFSSQFCHSPPSPWRNSSGRTVPTGVDHVDPPAQTISVRVSDGQSTDIHVESSPSAYVGSGDERSEGVGPGALAPARGSPTRPLPYQRPCASRSTSTRRCTPTGTSSRRSPSAASASICPYERQFTWEIPQLQPEQLKAIVEETHNEDNVLTAEPYPGAVHTIRHWHRAGPLHPHHEPPRDRRPPAHRAVAGRDRPPARRALLLLRQDHPLRRARDRHPDRRFPGEPRKCGESGYHRSHHRAPVEQGRA